MMYGPSHLNRLEAVTTSDDLSIDEPIDLLITCHGFESRSTQHLELPTQKALRKVSFGYEYPGDEDESFARTEMARATLAKEGFDLVTAGDDVIDQRLRIEIEELKRSRIVRVVADISSMNRSRIASLILSCGSNELLGCNLDIVYYPSSFGTHKHEYEPLESFGPVHDELAGWPKDPDLPLALIVGLGTEPRRADGIVESLEPDIVALYEPVGDETAFFDDLLSVNQRVIGIAGKPTSYPIRDPSKTFSLLSATVERLSEQARIVIVPLGPKVFSAIAVAVALSNGPEVGIWKASAGRGIQPVDVRGIEPPVIARLCFR